VIVFVDRTMSLIGKKRSKKYNFTSVGDHNFCMCNVANKFNLIMMNAKKYVNQ
jgi:hypothetical protein